MTWSIAFDERFADEFAVLDPTVQIEIEASVILLRRFGPQLARPHADTLKASRHANMKELRFKAGGGVWRLAYAFDPERSAILLVAADKGGVSERRFYRQLIATADDRFDAHLERLKKGSLTWQFRQTRSSPRQ